MSQTELILSVVGTLLAGLGAGWFAALLALPKTRAEAGKLQGETYSALVAELRLELDRLKRERDRALERLAEAERVIEALEAQLRPPG